MSTCRCGCGISPASRYAEYLPGHRPKMTIEQRMAGKAIRNADGCLEWTASLSPAGYGQVWDGERLQAAHRVAWSLVNGSIPDGMYACHRCDNRRCIEVTHLFLGTAADNTADMLSKGRAARPGAKVSPSDVEAIRAAVAAGELQRVVAERYGISQPQVSAIVNGRNWRAA